jgi:hypothetical protein
MRNMTETKLLGFLLLVLGENLYKYICQVGILLAAQLKNMPVVIGIVITSEYGTPLQSKYKIATRTLSHALQRITLYLENTMYRRTAGGSQPHVITRAGQAAVDCTSHACD